MATHWILAKLLSTLLAYVPSAEDTLAWKTELFVRRSYSAIVYRSNDEEGDVTLEAAIPLKFLVHVIVIYTYHLRSQSASP